MILYLDTSSLVKLYVEEAESAEIESIVKSSEAAATSIVAYAEARAAFARRFREGAFTHDDYNRLKQYFDKDWRNYFVLNVTEEVIGLAGNLSEEHALRGFDSIHLASAVILHRKTSSPVVFSCFDEQLMKAATQKGLNKKSETSREKTAVNHVHFQLLQKMAKKYVWWEMPDAAMIRPERIIKQVMNIGDFDDVLLLVESLGEPYLRKILKNAEAGDFNSRSWTYWHYRLGLAEPGHVPAPPKRKIQ